MGSQRPIFVVGNLKSGTSLIQSLLDDHPDLFVLPVELQFFKFPRLFSLPPGNMPSPPVPDWQVPIPRDSEDLENLKEEILGSGEVRSLLASGKVGRNIHLTDVQFDRQRFRELFEKTSVANLRQLYLAAVNACLVAAGLVRGLETDRRFVEKSPHMEEYAVLLKSWFPQAKFVHVLRNPYANLFSLQSGLYRKRHFREKFLRPMAKSFYFLERNLRFLDDYYVVRYEDIVLEPEATLRGLVNELGLSYQPSLESPTILGEPWGGNPQSVDDTFEGIDSRPVDAFQEEIAPLLVALINRFFGPFMEKHDYEKIEVGSIRPWLPMRWELPWHYISNRLLWLRGNL